VFVYITINRRHLQIHERAALATEIQKIEAEKAKQKQIEEGKKGGGKHGLVFKDLQHFPKILGNPQPKRQDTRKNQVRNKKPRPERKPNESRQRAAQQAKLSDETLRKYQYVLSI